MKKAAPTSSKKVYSIKQKIQLASQQTGIDEDKIGSIRLQLTALRNLGLVVNLEVSGMSLGVTSANIADWGLADADERLKRLRGGSKLLWREAIYKELRSCESSYRQLLKKYSYQVAGHCWVPFTAWQAYRAEALLIESRFKTIIAKIITTLDDQKSEYEVDVRKMYTQAWAAIKSQEYDSISIKGVLYKKPKDFVEDMTAAALRKFPSREDIETKIKMDYRTSVIGDMTDFEADQLRAERLKTLQVEEQAKQDKIVNEVLSEQLEMEAKREAIKQAELEHQRKQLAEMKSPLDDLANAMRGRIREAVEGMLESMKKNNNTLRGKVAEQVLNLGEIYKVMSVTSDPEVEKAMTELTRLVGPVGKERAKDTPDRDVESIRAAMLEIIDITNKEVETVAVADRLACLEF